MTLTDSLALLVSLPRT